MVSLGLVMVPTNHLQRPSSGDQGFRRKKTGIQKKEDRDSEKRRSEESRMPRATEDEPSESQLEKVMVTMVEQMRLQHKEMKTLFAALAPAQGTAIQEISKDQYDQLSKDVQKFVSDEEAGNTFAYWYKGQQEALILMKLDEDAYRKYADDFLPMPPHGIDFETTVANLQKLFASKKTLIRRRYECLRITCPPLTTSYGPFRDYANTIKPVDEDAQLKELDYTALKTLQSTCPLLSYDTGQKMRQRPRRRSYHRKRSQCKNVVTFAAENARTYLDVTIRGRSLRFHLDTGADITLISRRTWKQLGCPTLETWLTPVKTADGTPMKIDGPYSCRLCWITEWKDLSSGSRCIFEVAGSLRDVVIVNHCNVKRTQNVVRTIRQPKSDRVRQRNAVHSEGVPVLSTNTLCVDTWTSVSSRDVSRAPDENAVDSAEGISERRKNTQWKMEEQFNRHHGAQKRSYQMGDRAWVRDYRPGRGKWIPARVKKRYGQAVYDVLTEEGDLWRRHANQMRGEEQHWKSCENTDASDLPFHQEDRRYKDVEDTITDAKDNAEDRGATKVPPSPRTRPARQRRPPSRLRVDSKMKTAWSVMV
ncbi:hypothetical protein ANCDUO_01394 [Ancylostoma duodenale]|uniref:Peptidase A2 domain-containing protein n=1 Tax=Ancylostoma duodenale TaxID=51022 RepID=A0A0C2H9G7_9BILA|nr:hypothetical protein ANCDUO_01394 [Ancylostoma duodenale]